MTTTTQSLPLSAGTWAVDAAHSNVEFTVRHLGISKVRGRFNSFDASLTVGDSLETSQLKATVDLASVDTNNPDRDGHLKSTDFFNTEAYPQMSFVSSALVSDGEDYQVRGDLTLNGVTHPIILEVELNGQEANPMDQKVRAGFSATGSISRKQFGVEFEIPLGGDRVAIGDKVRIELEIQFIQP